MAALPNPYIAKDDITAVGLVQQCRRMRPGHVWVYRRDTGFDGLNHPRPEWCPKSEWCVCIAGVDSIFAISYHRPNAVKIANWLSLSTTSANK